MHVSSLLQDINEILKNGIKISHLAFYQIYAGFCLSKRLNITITFLIKIYIYNPSNPVICVREIIV